jgi:hypothetical protein
MTVADEDFPYWSDAATIRGRARQSLTPFGATPEERHALRPGSQEQAKRFLAEYGEPRSFLMFIAWPRSGHSLVGALLDAHPDMAIAHELHVFDWFGEEFTREQLMYFCWQNARHYGMAGRVWGDFDYTVPGQWQGRVRSLRVLGDKKGGDTSAVLARIPENLANTQKRLRLDMKIIHAVRHPLDNIATMALRLREEGADRPMVLALDRYRRYAQANQRVCETLGPSAITVWHEDLVADPRAELRRLAAFLDVEPDPTWIEACAATVRPSPNRSRDRIRWTESRLDVVRAMAREFDFLRRYEL